MVVRGRGVGTTRRLTRAFWLIEREFLGRASVLILGFRMAGILHCEWWQAMVPLGVFYLVEVVRDEQLRSH